MNAKLFGQYLIERGVITPDVLSQAMAEQQRANASLADLAVEAGLLTMDDVHTIRFEQLRNDQPFDRAALALGFLTPGQVGELRARQESQQVLLTQLLIERGLADFDALILAEYEYKQEELTRMRALEQILAAADFGEVASVAVSVMERVYPRLLGDSLRIVDATADLPIRAGERAWSQPLVVDGRTHVMALQMGEPEALKVAAVVLGVEVDRFDELAEDAVSEFLNILSGHVCGSLHAPSGGIHTKPPRVTSGFELLRDHRDLIVLRCDSGDVLFHFAFGSRAEARTRPTTTLNPTPQGLEPALSGV